MPSAGRILIIPKGNYDASVTYEMLDLVNHNGIPWIAKKTVTGIEPAEGEYWQSLLGIVIANNLETTEEGKILDARQGKVLADSIDMKGRFQRFGRNYTLASPLIETNSNIAFDIEEEKTLDMFKYVDGYYVAQKDMQAYIKVTVCANTIEEGGNKLYASIQYTPVGGAEVRWLEDVSYGTFTSITLSGVKNVKTGDKFRILNLEKVYVDSGFPCRPSGIEIIHM
jgi:hypothetical protein